MPGESAALVSLSARPPLSRLVSVGHVRQDHAALALGLANLWLRTLEAMPVPMVCDRPESPFTLPSPTFCGLRKRFFAEECLHVLPVLQEIQMREVSI